MENFIALPEAFTGNMKVLLGDEYSGFESSLHKVSPVSIRLNEGVKLPSAAGAGFPDFDFDFESSVPWCKSGVYLEKRPSFTLDPLFHSGSYYVQEAASMFLEQCVNTVKQYENIDYILDLCAAPGGKSTHLISLFPDSLIVSNEVIRSRTSALDENIGKWGHANTMITSCDPAMFQKLNSFFDFILVDAPCSGEGMFRKEPEALKGWSPANVKHCATRQLRIVRDVWDSLKPGGFMLYGTCTYNREENENLIRFIVENLGAESIPVDISAFEGIAPSVDKNIHACRFFPHKTKSEGLFLSLIRKNGEPKQNSTRKTKRFAKIPELNSWIQQSEMVAYIRNNDRIYLLPEKFAADVEFIGKTVHTLSSGTEICTVKGKELIPSLDFAHSTVINVSNFAVWEVDNATALKFLKKETLFAPPTNTGKGFVLITYRGVPLGWVKNIGSRCNNILPKSYLRFLIYDFRFLIYDFRLG
ncbi:MAG: rRNA cytosine-C5-methyltransferase [Prevotellaceae bacterium]|jgi:16S rRNA C967 or C1407 C5-methylase (RsmB/RsmF family)/NOL1/NOP2/fmu family ribosome biogenesis protein|nr:rRNA cytosine-C5-methyltransferase [Prevotellaceae bacterium]